MSKATHVLIVDDDPEFRGILRDVLGQEGCSVREADNGCKALEVLDEFTPDLIFVDLMMPVMNGWDFFAALQSDERLARVPIAILSAVARMRPVGSMHVLNKPIDLPNLLGLLDAIDAPESRP